MKKRDKSKKYIMNPPLLAKRNQKITNKKKEVYDSYKRLRPFTPSESHRMEVIDFTTVKLENGITVQIMNDTSLIKKRR